ncbi:FAD-binding oxidoreductase [Cellulomonas sp. APG4]|uniref:NAD(P)/FAD-dependent oxidoreductase n=1 Tax=Cellulomonas sp. APG4 TaxID=1538656 RepID=UPI00192A1F2A|nr:FAD-dependent oxidoreductase [Cellulomonas sp. APG4]
MNVAAAPSLWLERAWPAVPPRPAQTAPETVDVVVVGGGLTGLWTAYYLVRDHPGLDVLVLEAERVGFGASGRNGGWCSALFPASGATLARRHGEAAARDLRAAMRATVREVGDVTAAEDLGCGFVRGGTVTVARSAAQLTRLHAHAVEDRRWGDATEVLTAAEARTRLAADGVLGGTWNPDCARIDPGALVTGLARAVERRGARVREGSRVVTLRPGAVDVAVGPAGAPRPSTVTVRARHVVRATEAWTPRLPGRRRTLVPVYSLMVATEPLPASTWARVGLGDRETFTDGRHLIVYGQRTPDDRLAFGGRSAPYHWCSTVRPEHERVPRVHRALEHAVVDLLPALRGVRFTHRWGRRARRAARLARIRGPRRRRRRVGGWLRGRRRRDGEPRGPHPRRPAHRARDGAHGAAVGGPPLAALGAGAAALGGRHGRRGRGPARGCRGAADRAAQSRGARDGTAGRGLSAHPRPAGRLRRVPGARRPWSAPTPRRRAPRRA